MSHTSRTDFLPYAEISQAPVIASHSSARAVCDVPRNLDNDMLHAIASCGGPESNGGVVHVNFYSGFVCPEYRAAQRAMMSEVDQAVKQAEAQAMAEGRAFT